jgi:nicotinate phosphoribosyltransferase
MAHSYVLAHDEEMDAFRRFTQTYPETVLLVDTYDTLEGVRKVIRLAGELGDAFAVSGVRLDSGDLEELARRSRELLDGAGLHKVKIFASGDLDEHAIEALTAAGAPIDAFGIGTALVTSADAPYLNCAYKLVQYAGAHRMKLSSGKATLPGRKQVYRRSAAGAFSGDIIALHDESHEGEPLLHKVMENGRRVPDTRPSLEAMRRYHAGQRDALPAAIRRLADPQPYPVEVSGPLRRATEALTRRLEAD